jgi:hypothetical protein
VKNRVGVEVLKLKAIIEKKAAEEIRSWKSESALDKILERYDFTSFLIRPLVPSGGPPLDNLLWLEDTIIYKCLKISFRALTCSPSVTGGGGRCKILQLRLGGTFLALLVTSRFTRICSGAGVFSGRAVPWRRREISMAIPSGSSFT